ncbi:MAG: hypothetical protein IAE77_03565 [Prosthecobacter sp.]|jgi:hypothetical protein|uniref:hypothetical protein n=1 Tax=Prosthecobacter sp. TaxID=1965333 RepID=UPI0019FB480E|nr:hypothetical protein [Prosthecobacter sp.]MBE2282522.1 hypothetical protein [Prosthecobacter sp.]
MPFDPTKPANNSPNSSAEMRSQLTSLKALIDAILTITAAQVDGVNTLPPGNAANVSLSVVGNTLHFTFDIPQGEVGPTGEVTTNDMNNAISNAISGTSNNTNGVSTLGQSADFNYNQSQMQDVLNKLDEFINAARR